MRSRISFVVGAGLLLALPAYAGDDAQFVKKAANGGLMEVELGRYAENHAADPAVKDFGRRMVEDHGKANQELKAIAQKHKLQVPTAMDTEHSQKAHNLMSKTGADFDRAYMDAMVSDHEQDVAEFQDEARDGKSDIDRWAAKTAPTLESHLQMARQVDRKLGGSAGTMGGASGRSGAMGLGHETGRSGAESDATGRMGSGATNP